MKRFTNPIPESVRAGMSVCPPPLYGKDAKLMPWPLQMRQKYKDMELEKENARIYIDEELDVFSYPGTRTRFRMTIRCLSCHADLDLVLLAAKHLDLVSEYSYSQEFRENISPELESAYIDLQYVRGICSSPDGGKHRTLLDADTEGELPIDMDGWMRRKIWNELFFAAGYRHVIWGNRVLNVKRRQL